MKKISWFQSAALVAMALASNGALAQFNPGNPGSGPDGFGRSRGGWDACRWLDRQNGSYFRDLQQQVQDIVDHAQAVKNYAAGVLSSPQSRWYTQGARGIDAYLAIGAYLGQAQTTLDITNINWDTFQQRADLSRAVDNLETSLNAIKSNDVFGIYQQFGFQPSYGQQLDCDLQDVRRIVTRLTDWWNRPMPGPGPGPGPIVPAPRQVEITHARFATILSGGAEYKITEQGITLNRVTYQQDPNVPGARDPNLPAVRQTAGPMELPNFRQAPNFAELQVVAAKVRGPDQATVQYRSEDRGRTVYVTIMIGSQRKAVLEHTVEVDVRYYATFPGR